MRGDVATACYNYIKAEENNEPATVENEHCRQCFFALNAYSEVITCMQKQKLRCTQDENNFSIQIQEKFCIRPVLEHYQTVSYWQKNATYRNNIEMLITLQ